VLARDEDVLTVLLGDINEWLVYGRPLRWLHRRFGCPPHVRTWPAFFPVFALDRIWSFPPGAMRRLWVPRVAEVRVASDHMPILAELSWRLDPYVSSPTRKSVTGS
jgi:endonuclease/exonuclease/phosphatase family metal-dependent hydrolase